MPAGTYIEYVYEAVDDNRWLCLEGQEYVEAGEDPAFECDVWVAAEYEGQVLCEAP